VSLDAAARLRYAPAALRAALPDDVVLRLIVLVSVAIHGHAGDRR
jgi:hypothetical protein